ncbi:MAG: molybdopterin-dependent oxidoreductase [Firmicutes bacterium]|nr:molybdopterin-dependent oxidoreductase [Bacillota bacterium]
MKTLCELPVFPSSQGRTIPAEWWLVVDGMVRNPLKLSMAELSVFPAAELGADFTCVEGWRVPGLRWEGPELKDLLKRAEPLPEARFALLHSGEYRVAIPLDEEGLAEGVVASRLNGAPLDAPHGAPLRYVSPSPDCFDSVKWLERIELTDRAEEATGAKIALTRIGRLKKLSEMEPGEAGEIVQVDPIDHDLPDLEAKGLIPKLEKGLWLKVLARSAGGPVMLEAGDQQYDVCGDVAGVVWVQPRKQRAEPADPA